MCIGLDEMLFTGDTIMPFKPYFNGRDSNEDDWIDSIARIRSSYNGSTIIYPGHGDKLTLEEWTGNFSKFL
jgi:glyoxylase-like metal-dependent hydrolase (beta-lactamase superfamily II)